MTLAAVETDTPVLARVRAQSASLVPAGSLARPVPEGDRASKAVLSGRQACVLFGLRQRREGASAEPAVALVEPLSRATAEDCLAAAFGAGAEAEPRAVVSVAAGAEAAPPFGDDAYYAGIARWLGCRFDAGLGLCAAVRTSGAQTLREPGHGPALSFSIGGVPTVAIAPEPHSLPRLATILCVQPETRRRLVIATPAAIASAAEWAEPAVVPGRVEPLHGAHPMEVADKVMTRWQSAVGAMVLLLFATASVWALIPTLITATLAVSATLVMYAASRGLAVVAPFIPPLPRRPLRASELPVYTVLIPLYRENEGVAELVKALRRIDYPAAKLDIQFLVEEDDPVTKDALLRDGQHLPCRIVVCPGGGPRTKPRALNAGLRQARGSLVTIYDAEDRPEPGQLRLAAETFAAADETLAAVQARLAIDHVDENWLTRMFAIEYACQFDRLLPMVAGRGGMVLLGGTSNHFRTDALLEVGGWDPFNVTEDADLAVRLCRHGFRLAVIESDTYEEAPLTMKAWLKQRSRWFKGYVQTWLVHNRKPLTVVRELGWRDAALMHLFIIGALTAALAHNVFVALLVLSAVGIVPLFGGQHVALVALQVALAVASYGVNFLLGVVCIRARKRDKLSPWTVCWFPVYWMLMGVAVAIALYDLVRRPHHWRKTTHGVARRPSRLRPQRSG